MLSDAQFRTLLKDKDTATLRSMERNPQFTTEQWAMIAHELHSRPSNTVATVRVTDIDIPFGSMVSFMVKWALASIPAFLILTVFGIVLMAFLAALGLTLRPPTV